MKVNTKYAVVLELEDGVTISLGQPDATAMEVVGKQFRAINYYEGRRINTVHLETNSRTLIPRSSR